MSLPPDPRRAYLAEDPVEDSQRARKHRLVQEVKRVIDHVALLDIAELDPGVLDRLSEQAAALAGNLDPLPSLRRYGGAASSPVEDAALRERSGFSGRSNPLAPPMHLEAADHDDRLNAWAVWTDAYEGPAGCLHGGYVAAAFDDLLGLVQIASGTAGYTGTLTVRMMRPTPLNVRIDYEAGFDRIEGRKIFCWGKAFHGGELLAEASIVFISPREGLIPEARGM